MQLMSDDDKKFRSDAESSSSGEWERVQGTEVPSPVGALRSSKDWDGIVGFFHPFWSVITFSHIPSA